MNLIGKKISELSTEALEEIVFFLDIDETIGKAISIKQHDVPENFREELYEEYPPRYRLIYTTHLHGCTYLFCYYKKWLSRWSRVEVIFEFRAAFDGLIDFFVVNNISEVYFLSAATEEYIEAIQYIVRSEYGFYVKGYVSVCDKEQRNILVDSKVVLYMEKDMEHAMDVLLIGEGKTPVLFDDRSYWAKNGYVVPIQPYQPHSLCVDRVSIYLDAPIEQFKAPLFILYEEPEID